MKKKLTTMQQLILSLAKKNGNPVYICDTHSVFTSINNKCPYCEKECNKYEE